MKEGDKIRGFKFKTTKNLEWNSEMNDFIGEIGIITDFDSGDDSIKVDFYDENGNQYDFWYYPWKEAIKHLVIESNDLFPIY